MNHIDKELIFTAIVSIAVITLLAWILRYTTNDTVDMYEYALTQATSDATLVVREDRNEDGSNSNYGGFEKGEEKINIDYKGALKSFYNTIFYNLGISTNIEAKNAFRSHIPIKGVVGYDNIVICTYNDIWLPPESYSYFDKDRDLIYRFTLGEVVYVYDINTGTDTKETLDSLIQITTDMTNKQLKNYVVMETINKALTKAASSELNYTSLNLMKGVVFNLVHFDHEVIGGRDIYNSEGNIIDSPGFFAMIDGIAVGLNSERIRLASFGGAKMEVINK
ncbi:hypothetical protein [Sporosalibacterium faouarense]|uniref:hypothetical protein n=1 Tax=Sporosalibacterium faouarense TaxID=516123 RepID=UPI00192A9E64|nr:hypothetical protein [Sporosalibacterium faouarense]